MKIKKRIGDIFRIFIGVSILSLLILKLGVAEVLGVISNMNLYIVLLVLFSSLFIYFLASINIKILINGLGEKISAFDSFKYYLPPYTLGLLTPGKVGNLSLLYFFKKNEISYGKTLAVLVLDKLITYVVLSVIAIYGFFIFFEREAALQVTFYLILLLLLGVLLIRSKRARRLIQDILLAKYAKSLEGFYRNLEFLLKHRKGRIALNASLTFGQWVLGAFVKYLIFLYFDVPVLFFAVLAINCMGAILAMLPVSISGLGITEGSAVYLFYKIGVDPTITGGIFLFVTFMRYMVASAVLGFYGKEIKDVAISSKKIFMDEY
ncbi:MAG: lysylphosphatidylglycerol synthase transmembrane domain-containing protein [Methanocellales archaeon]|nr:lysylphosphatidylglycerol synthase transmembrane domain-containing protein [Methanocellales archaeon]